MGTTYTIRLFSEGKTISYFEEREIKNAVQKELDRIDLIFSTWKSESEISRFNRWPENKRFYISPEFTEVFLKSYEIYIKSGGAFDPTIGPLIDLWGFGSRTFSGKIPEQNTIEKALQNTGLMQIAFENSNGISLVKKNKNIELNLSAIAKGYAVDRIYLTLSNMGYNSTMIEVGGEIRTGNPPNGKQTWKIGIEKPDSSQTKSIQKIISLSGQSIATSGDYRNFFHLNGQNYSHIIDPSDGMPVRGSIASASVIGPDCMTADALATAILVMDPAQAFYFLSLFPGFEAYLLLRSPAGTIDEKWTQGMENFFDGSSGKTP
ncbi:MAG: FAD:protein FMN transferase [Spirochaetia bacterium]|nr:FAD:protein FMN transferase [Spirochaetia bacterium]